MKTIINVLTISLMIAELCLSKKEVNFVRIANCTEFKNNSVIFQNVVFTKNNKGRTIAMRYELLFKKEVKGMMIMITLLKCDNSENLDSCEYYMKDFKIKNACQMIAQQDQMWSKAFSNSNFPSSCPISAGLYKLNDTKADVDITLMPVPIAYWKIKFHLYDSGNDNIMVACSNWDVKVYTARRNS